MWLRSRARPPSLSVLDQLKVGVIVLDRLDNLILANPAARRMGLVRSAGGHDDLAVAAVRTLVASVRRTGVCRELELDIPQATGLGQRSVNVRVGPVGAGYVTVEVADVTEAHRLAKVRRDFVANVSHELKTPVGALRLLAEALLEATDGGAGRESDQDEWLEDQGAATEAPDLVAVRRFAQRIKHESTRLGRLVGDLLELTRLQGADPLPEPAPVSVDAIVAEVVDRSRTQAAAKQIEVVVEGMGGLTVYGNESQLVTAIANLVDNAIAYSPERTRVGLAVRAVADHIEITVTDEGIGIEPKDLDRIFERFYRADRARSRDTGGTGLGLAIVKHVATNHRGAVTVASTVGAGSTFTLRLSACPPDAGWRAERGGSGGVDPEAEEDS